jgi:hypothetical protein
MHAHTHIHTRTHMKQASLPGSVRHDVGDDTQGGLGRVDVGVADHELFEDVVLDRAGKL